MISIVLFFINMFFINKPPITPDQRSTDRLTEINIIMTNAMGKNWPYTIFLLCIMLIIFFYLFYLTFNTSCIEFSSGANNKNINLLLTVAISFLILFFFNLIMLTKKIMQTQKYMNSYCVDAPDASNPSSPLVSSDILKLVGLIFFIISLIIITFVIVSKTQKKSSQVSPDAVIITNPPLPPPDAVIMTNLPLPPPDAYNLPLPPTDAYNLPLPPADAVIMAN
jgi:hypothetical protein